MADAKKCDRCGKYYDDYHGVVFSEAAPSNKYDRMNLVRADDYEGRYKRFDLCPDCMKALISFIKQGEKQC